MKNNFFKMFISLSLILMLTSCATYVSKDKKYITHPKTKEKVTENIICKPIDKDSIKIYRDNKINIEDLDDCKNIKIIGSKDKYDGLFTSFLVKPLAKVTIFISKIINSIGISIIIITILIKLLLFKVTKKQLEQSKIMAKIQPELKKIEEKYKNVQDKEAYFRKSQEISMIYKKYNLNPISSILGPFIQLLILYVMFDVITRVPIIYESSFLGFNLGISPLNAINSHQSLSYLYIIFVLINFVLTFLSLKSMQSQNPNTKDNIMANQMNIMIKIMPVLVIIFSSLSPIALNIYWIIQSLISILQNIYINRKEK